MPAPRHALLFVAILAVTGCASAPTPAQASSGTIDAVNHTHWAINHFSVDGRNAIDAIGPNQGGGGLLLLGACTMEAGDDRADRVGDRSKRRQ